MKHKKTKSNLTRALLQILTGVSTPTRIVPITEAHHTHLPSDPAHDLQAMDRAYRYGQTRDVYVYRLIGAGSLEEHIYARQIYKQQMAVTAYEGTTQTRYFAGVQGDKNQQGYVFWAFLWMVREVLTMVC